MDYFPSILQSIFTHSYLCDEQITAIKAFKDLKEFSSYGSLEQTAFLADVIT